MYQPKPIDTADVQLSEDLTALGRRPSGRGLALRRGKGQQRKDHPLSRGIRRAAGEREAL